MTIKKIRREGGEGDCIAAPPPPVGPCGFISRFRKCLQGGRVRIRRLGAGPLPPQMSWPYCVFAKNKRYIVSVAPEPRPLHRCHEHGPAPLVSFVALVLGAAVHALFERRVAVSSHLLRKTFVYIICGKAFLTLVVS